MAERYRAYQSYRPSEVRWLDDVPSDWEIRRTKRVLELKRTKVGKAATDFQLLSLTLNGIIPRDITDGSGKIPAEFDTYQEVSVSDLVFCLFDIDETPRTIGISNNEGMITGAYNVYRCLDDADAKFYFYYFLHLDSFKGLRPFYTGLRKVVRSDTFDNKPLPCPSLPEQTQIAAFLDHETAKIDALIAEQQRLIALLEEKRQAVISHAVTKGLNPDAPLRPSGIDWLGDVPAHWEVQKLKYVSPQITVGIVVEPSKYYTPKGVPALRSLNVAQGNVKLENMVFISKAANELHSKSKLQSGDLVAVRTGQPGTTSVIPSDLDGCNCIDLIIIRKPKDGSEFFLCWYLASDFSLIQFSTGSGGAIQQHFNVGTAANVVVSVPPPLEQESIVEFLDSETRKLDDLIAKSQHAADLLRERRTALISAAVTGKIDVRDWTPPEAKDEAA